MVADQGSGFHLRRGRDGKGISRDAAEPSNGSNLMDRTVDSWFGDYRRSGDPEALGRVFDALASRLAGRALLVLGDSAAAEDALQSTFLAAMEHADRWDHIRPLESWLFGILQHEIRRLRARRRHDPLDQALDTLLGPDADPAERAQRDDLIAQVRQGVDDLPEGERQVLLLRLEHGLSALEIGEVLGLAPGTVRMRVHRGLERLRRRLPASLALVAIPTVRFAAVRDAVLAAVPESVAVGASLAGAGVLSSLGIGVLGMKKLVGVLLLLGGLSLAAVLGWQQFASWPAAAAPEVGAPQTRIGTLPDAEYGEDEVDADASSSREMLPAEAERPVEPLLASVLFRLTHSGGGPASGVTVNVSPADGATLIESGLLGTTDERGEVRFADLVPGELEFEVPCCMRRGRVQLQAGLEHRQDLSLTGIPEVAGIVVDAADQPIAGAEVLVAAGARRVGHVRTHSDGSGRFVVRDVLGGYAHLSACAPGYAPSGSVPVMDGDREIRLVLSSAGAVVRGVVVAEPDGRPVLGARVIVGGRSGGQDVRVGRHEYRLGYMPRLVHCDAEGRFEVQGAPCGSVEFLVDAPGFVTASHHFDLIPGTPRDLRLVLSPALAVTGEIVDSSTGAPILGASVWSEAFTSRQTASVRTGPGGRFSLDRFDPRRPLLCVAAGGYEPYRELLEPGRTVAGERLRIPLRIAPRTRVRFRLADGSPFAPGGTVRFEYSGDVSRSGAGVAEVHFASRSLDDAGAGDLSLAADRLRALWVTPDDPRQWIRCDWLALPLAPDVEELVVDVPDQALPSAWLTGVLLDADGQPESDTYVDLERDGLTVGGIGFPDKETGAFRSGPLPPGTYRARVPVADRTTVFLDLGEITLRPGETLDLGILGPGQGGAPRPGRLVVETGDESADGLVDLHAWIDFLANDRSDETFVGDIAPGVPEDRTQALMPGHYRLTVYGDDTAWRSIDFEIEEGEDTRVTLDLQPATRRYLTFPWPVPAAIRDAREVHFELRDAQGDCVVRDTLGDERPMTLMPALTLGRNVVELWTDAGDRFLGEVLIEDLAPDHEPIPVAVERVR